MKQSNAGGQWASLTRWKQYLRNATLSAHRIRNRSYPNEDQTREAHTVDTPQIEDEDPGGSLMKLYQDRGEQQETGFFV